MKNRWIGYVAKRYVSRNRKNSPSVVFSILGIATGVLALIVIISVMNGFQLGFIESILEISSGHLRIEDFPLDDEAVNHIRSLAGISSALPFRETSVLMRGRSANPRGVLVRGLPPDALSLDPGLGNRLVMESGSFDLSSEDNIVLGSELSRHLSVYTGDLVSMLAVSGGGFLLDDEEDLYYHVTGIFHSGYYEYDLGWAFINIDRAARLASPEEKPVLLVKLEDRWQDQRIMTQVNNLLEDISASSWRDYNRSFFSALRTEKLMMFILVGLIFIVVGLNIFQSQRRTVLERREEIGMLRTLGASDTEVRLVFVLDGFIIGFCGAITGMITGLFIAFNISAFFTFLETLVNLFISMINKLAILFGADEAAFFSVFSPTIFYIKEIPSRIIPYEVMMICLFGLLSALAAAWFASGRVSRMRPAEVLRYE